MAGLFSHPSLATAGGRDASLVLLRPHHGSCGTYSLISQTELGLEDESTHFSPGGNRSDVEELRDV